LAKRESEFRRQGFAAQGAAPGLRIQPIILGCFSSLTNYQGWRRTREQLFAPQQWFIQRSLRAQRAQTGSSKDSRV